MDAIHRAKLDKSAFSVASLTDEPDEKQYWLSKSPYERLRALELMRQIAYGYDPSTDEFKDFLKLLNTNQVEYLWKHLKINLKIKKKVSGRYKDLNDLEYLP